MEDYNKIYPQLPPNGDHDKTYPPLLQDGDNFRLHQSSKYLSDLERELRDREKIYKKYKRTCGILMKISADSAVLSIIFSGSGVGTSLTGVGLPVGLSLASIGGFCGIMSVTTGIFAKKISPKLSKHEKTVSICTAKVNTIKDIVSKALKDNKISHEEFLLIKAEIDKYQEMKRSVRMKKSQKNEGVNVTELKRQIRAEMLRNLSQSQTQLASK